MAIFDYVEWFFGTLLSWVKHHYSKTLHQHQILSQFPKPSITVTSPEYETLPSNHEFKTPAGEPFAIHEMRKEHTQFGADKPVSLQWNADPSIAAKVKQWVVVIEDPDAPVPFVITHAAFYGIPAEKTSVVPADLELVDGVKLTDVPLAVKGGFRAGKTLRGLVHIGPRPPYGHGAHLYMYQVLALGEDVQWSKWENEKGVTVNDVCKAVEGKVLGWGMWVGSVEKKWER